MSDFNLLLEAERRGLLDDERKGLLAEARRRGLVEGGGSAPDINFDAPDEEVRKNIAALPAEQQMEARNKWGDAYVAREREKGGVWQTVNNTVRTLARGTFIGPYLDEISAATANPVAAVRAAVSGESDPSSAPYYERLAYERAQDRAVDKANPILSTVGKLAGGVAGGVGAARSGSLIPMPSSMRGLIALGIGGPFAAGAPTGNMAQQVLKSGGMGAAYGASAGFGAGEGSFEDRAQQAGTDMVVGGVIGSAAPPIIKGVSTVANQVGEAISPAVARAQATIMDKIRFPLMSYGGEAPVSPGAQAAADQVIANQLTRANVTPQMLRGRMNEADEAARYYANSRAQNAIAPVDLDPSLQRLAGSAYRQQPEAANTMVAFQAGRQTGQTPRLARAPGRTDEQSAEVFRKATGLPNRPTLSRPDKDAPPAGQFERMKDALKRALLLKDEDFHGHAGNAYRTEQGILQAAKDEANTLYSKATNLAKGVDLSPTVNPILQNWTNRLIDEPVEVSRVLQKYIRNFQRALSPQGNKSHLERVDKVKQSLDDVIDAAFNSANGRSKYLGGQLTEFKNEILEAIDNLPKIGPAYKEARNAFSSRMEARDALRLGQSVFKEDSNLSIDEFRQLSDGNKKLFRLGMLDGFEKDMGRKARRLDVTTVFESPRVQEILQEVIERTETATGKVVKDAVFGNRPERFGKYIENEKAMRQTGQEVFGGSPTQQRRVDDAAFEDLQNIVENFKQSRSVIDVGMRLIESTLNRMFGMRADTAQAIAQRLFTADPRQREALLRSLEQRMGPSRYAEFTRLMNQYQRIYSQSVAGTAAQSGESGSP